MRRIGILFLLTALFPLAAAEIAWEINPKFPADGQGLLINGFKWPPTVTPEGTLKLTAVLPEASAPGPHLRSCYEKFVPYDSKDLGTLELRLRSTVPAGLKIRLQWFKGGESEQTVPQIADGEFHTYRFDFAKFKHPDANSRGFYLYVYPAVNPDGAKGNIELELDYLRIEYSREGAVRAIAASADTKLPDMAALNRSFAPYGIAPEGAEKRLKTLQETRRALDAEKNPEKQHTLALSLNREFAELHRRLTPGRRLKQLIDDSAAYSRSLAFAELPKAELLPAAERERLAGLLKRGEFDAAEKALETAENRSFEAWNRLPGNTWQSGVSETSTGLYGWTYRNPEGPALSAGRELVWRGFFVNRDGTKTRLEVRPEGSEFTDAPPQNRHIDWTSGEWSYPCKTKEGRSVEWNLAFSRLAPGVLLSTDARTLRLTIQAGRDYRPTRFLIPRRGGAVLLAPEELAAFPWNQLAENWLLVLCDNGLPSVPWLVTLQHRPQAAAIKGDALLLTFARKAGTVGISNLHGVRPLPPNWADGWKAAPEGVVEQCRRLNAVMTAYPWRCEEFFAVDQKSGKLRIANRFLYRKAANDWKYDGREYAPLPPVLAFAAAKGYPAGLPEETADFDFDTIYGPWRAVPGNQSEYTLPLPDLREALPLRTERYPELQAKSRRWFRGLPDLRHESSPGRFISITWAWQFDGFQLYTPAEKRTVLTDFESVVDRYYTETREKRAQLQMPDFSHGHGERTEPFTGKSYFAYGWKSKHGDQLNYHDITDFAGFFLLPTLRYAQLSGDWKLIQKHWRPVTELYGSLPRRAEWATLAVGTTDRSLVHVIDMAPDSWIASEAMAKLARGVGDRRAEGLALCIAAKEAVSLVAAQQKREWDMAHNNNWDWNTQIPELGYFEQSHINSTRWDDAVLSTSAVFGCLYTPAILRLYQEFAPGVLGRFLHRLESAYPQWNDVAYIRKGKKTGQNGPQAFYRQLMIREALGESTAQLEKIRRTGLFNDNEFSVWSHPVEGRSVIVGLSLSGGALLVGRDAPLHLAGWGNAALKDAEFSFQGGKATVVLASKAPFALELRTPLEPAEIRVNNAPLPPERRNYDAGRKLLSLQLAAGESRVLLTYPGWTPPGRSMPEVTDTIAITPEIELCRAERELRLAPQQKRTDFQAGITVPIPLESYFNQAFDSPQTDEINVRGISMRLGKAAVGIGKSRELPAGITGIPAAGKWKRLYVLHAADREWNSGTPILRYRIHYEDGTEAFFEAAAGRELSSWLSSGEFPNGKAAIEQVRNGQKQTWYLSSWENTARREVAGVIADFQKECKKIISIDLEFVPGEGSAVLLAISGETAEE